VFDPAVQVDSIEPAGARAASVEMLAVTKRFGDFTALDAVSLTVAAGSFHALLGENGAGKSTLVKCLIGYQPCDAGAIVVDGRERNMRSPRDAAALGIGMVFQHFTLAPNLTVAENLLIARSDLPHRLDHREEFARLERLLAGMPFEIRLARKAGELAAGEKQKVEIVKQLYLGRRLIVLDEPTSVLTPAEADELLGYLRERTRSGELTVLMITHKFREVMAFADRVSVLRRGRLVGDASVAEVDTDRLSAWMMGAVIGVPGAAAPRVAAPPASVSRGRVVLRVAGLEVMGDQGLPAVDRLDLDVSAGEVLGIAGVSGNGQRELVEALLGQRRSHRGTIEVDGTPYGGSRREIRALGVRSLPEEPLRNACVASMSVAENMALRNYDVRPLARGILLDRSALVAQARSLVDQFEVRTTGPLAPIGSLSGGNVQRAVLARELSRGNGAGVRLLIVANPVFGLDFRAVEAIHTRLRAARDAGCAILLVSEDLDELLELADRIAVMHAGRITYECNAVAADVATLGRAMAGDHLPGNLLPA